VQLHYAGHDAEVHQTVISLLQIPASYRLKNSTFDAVFAVHLMGHLPEPDRKQVPYGLFPILRPGGIIFFSDFSTEDFRYGSGCELAPATFRRGTGIITHYFSRQEVIDLFSPFTPVSVSIQRWKMKVRGKDLVRSEIKGIFTR
jgi:2-polyprenyl-3-methyl-5-hydroxy-6-metoxy-1,4-benzoquinol methylase